MITSYYRGMFREENMVFTVVADLDENKVRDMVEKSLKTYSLYGQSAIIQTGTSAIPATTGTPTLPVNPPFSKSLSRHNHQVHCIIGARAYSAYDNRRVPLSLLINILGGPVANSRLNLILRERYGLVYSVEASYGLYSDAGIATIYFGCDRSSLDRCLTLTDKVLASLREETISSRALNWAKKQLLGQMAIASDNGEAQVLSMGKSLMTYGRVITNAESARMVEAITAEDLRRTAEEVFEPAGLSRLIYN